MGCLAAGKIIAGLALHWPCIIGVSSSPAVCSYAHGIWRYQGGELWSTWSYYLLRNNLRTNSSLWVISMLMLNVTTKHGEHTLACSGQWELEWNSLNIPLVLIYQTQPAHHQHSFQQTDNHKTSWINNTGTEHLLHVHFSGIYYAKQSYLHSAK